MEGQSSNGFVAWIYNVASLLELNSVYGVIKLIVDLFLVAIIFYFLYRIVRKTKAMQILKGFAVLIVLVLIAHIFNLVILKIILTYFMNSAILLIIVIFQPELRTAFEKIGRNSKIGNVFHVEESMAAKHTASEISKAVEVLALKKISAVMIIERGLDISDAAKEGITINGKLSNELLQNIFMPRSYLQSGAVIINKNIIRLAKCSLPLASESHMPNGNLDVRYRSAVGITEISDAIAVVVSEEDGKVAVAENGKLKMDVSSDKLKDYLADRLQPDSIVKSFKDMKKNKKRVDSI